MVDGVVRIQVGFVTKTRAVAIRCQRDRVFGNRFPVQRGDMRHVGEIGEICVNGWLRNVLRDWRVVWSKNLSEVLTLPDFTVGRVRIDVKTVKRQGYFDYARYQVGVTSAHVDAGVDGFLFCSFNTTTDVLEILGGMSRRSLVRLGRPASAGEAVHADYTIREGHSVLVAQGSQLLLPAGFLQWIVATDRDRDRPAPKFSGFNL